MSDTMGSVLVGPAMPEVLCSTSHYKSIRSSKSRFWFAMKTKQRD